MLKLLVWFWCLMGFSTEAQAKTQIANWIRILNNHRNNMATATTGYIALEDTFNQALFTEYKQEVGAGVGAVRNAMNGPLLAGGIVVNALLREYAGVIGSAPEQDPLSNLKRLYQYYIDNTLSVLTRGFTFGSPAAAAGIVGNGTLNRLNADENGKNIDNQYPDSKTAYCIADEHSGRPKHQEQFELRGSQKEIDELKRVGSSAYGLINALSAVDVQPYLSNPSFENYSGTASVPTAITDWTVTTNISNFSIDTTNTYRDYDGVGTSAALKWAAAANDTVTQNITTRRAAFKRGIPYYMQLAWNRSIGSGDGTMTFTVGNVNTNVVMAAQSGWQILRIPIGSNNWLVNFDLNTLNVSIARTLATTGTILVDDIIIAPFTPFDNSWYAMVGGSTKFLVKDKFTWSDSIGGTEGIIQHFLWRLLGGYLPSVTSGPTFAEPASP